MTSPQQMMQRLKVGLAGLAAVVLLIGLASAIFSAASRDRGVVPPPGTTIGNSALLNAAADSENEPLAELGVAPSADPNTAAPAPSR